MVAALLRAQLRRPEVLASMRKPLTLSFRTLSSPLTPSQFEKCGWEFSHYPCDSDFDRLEASGSRLPQYYNNLEFCIKHQHSGLKFTFNAYDALCKWLQEKKTHNPLESDLSEHVLCSFPSYDSPLLPLVGHGYDSAYVGSQFIEKPGKESQKIIPKWEDLDWENLHEQFYWTIENDLLLSDESRSSRYLSLEEWAPIFRDQNKVYNDKSKNVCSLKSCLYSDPCESGFSFGYLSLVVTDCGWFVHLKQCLYKIDKILRARHITMHCDHEKATIYREIIEEQLRESKNRSPTNATELVSLDCATIWPHFHEVKKFNIQGAYMGDSSSCAVDDAKKYKTFTVDEWKEVYHRVSGVIPKITSLFADCGNELQSIEEKMNARIQIIPAFQNPCYSLGTDETWDANVPLSAYIRGLSGTDLSTFNCIDDVLKRV